MRRAGFRDFQSTGFLCSFRSSKQVPTFRPEMNSYRAFGNSQGHSWATHRPLIGHSEATQRPLVKHIQNGSGSL